jgi:hypothetical protein
MLKIEQTITCDICNKEMNSLTQFVTRGNGPMQMIERGPAGTSRWNDVCTECCDPLFNAVWALKTAKNAEKTQEK